MPRRTAAAVERTRTEVTGLAVGHASVEGLEALTIGRLADQAGLSKSGLFGLFGSKEGLQRATLDAAVEHFVAEVWAPVADEEPGRPRLLALIDCWLGYHARDALPGGCFLTTAMVEFDARPGALRDDIARHMARWLGVLEREARVAADAGELPAGSDPADVAFQLNALASAASTGRHLTGGDEPLERARRLMRAAVGA
jgi:AcrR family transcriptional regulator